MAGFVDPENGAYSRRRIDELTDQKIRDLGHDVADIKGDVKEVDRKVDALSNRIAWLFGAIAALSFLFNLFGPIVAKALLGV